jgi:hypothetical protein
MQAVGLWAAGGCRVIAPAAYKSCSAGIAQHTHFQTAVYHCAVGMLLPVIVRTRALSTAAWSDRTAGLNSRATARRC